MNSLFCEAHIHTMSTEVKQITLALIGLYTVCYNEIIVIAIQPYSVCVHERDSLALLLYNVYWLQETGLSAREREKEQIDKNTKK